VLAAREDPAAHAVIEREDAGGLSQGEDRRIDDRARSTLGHLGLRLRRHLRSSINATKVLREIDIRQRNGASEPSGVREYLRRERPFRADEGWSSNAERSQAPCANPNSVAEIGGHRPEPAPRLEKAKCCQASFVERFLRRRRGRWPHGTNGISPGWPDWRNPALEIDRAGSFLTQRFMRAGPRALGAVKIGAIPPTCLRKGRRSDRL
jgi:hypothetical protein